MWMYFVYILQSEKDRNFYIGLTSNLKKRFIEHNNGRSKYSATKRPFKIAWYGCFRSKEKALSFEKYLKSSSGFAFRNKHLI